MIFSMCKWPYFSRTGLGVKSNLADKDLSIRLSSQDLNDPGPMGSSPDRNSEQNLTASSHICAYAIDPSERF